MSFITRLIVFLPILALNYINNLNCYAQPTDEIKLVKAEICEDSKQGECIFPNKILPFSNNKVFCYTAFDSIGKPTFIYHKWYYRDEPMATFTLKLKPGYYASLSNIQIREKDKGPWKVEIVDSNNKILMVLRFSIVD